MDRGLGGGSLVERAGRQIRAGRAAQGALRPVHRGHQEHRKGAREPREADGKQTDRQRSSQLGADLPLVGEPED